MPNKNTEPSSPEPELQEEAQGQQPQAPAPVVDPPNVFTPNSPYHILGPAPDAPPEATEVANDQARPFGKGNSPVSFNSELAKAYAQERAEGE